MEELNKKRPQFAEASFANFNAIVWLLLSLRFAAGGRHGSHFLAVRSLDAGGFALQVAQVIQPCPANFTLADHFNRADRGRRPPANALQPAAKPDPPPPKGRPEPPPLL